MVPSARRILVLVAIALSLLAPLSARAAPRADDEKLREMLARWLEQQDVHEPPPPCTDDCYVLSTLSLRGAVDDSLAFVAKGTLLAPGPVKVALFGPSSQVRLDDLTLDGAPPVVGFEDDHYFVLTSAPSFTLRGRITLGSDEMLGVAGPLVALDAKLARGRLVEGEKLSGLSRATLHFDPMTPESANEAEARTPKVFHLARAVRIAKETGFIYRLTASQAQDLGVVRLPLRYGERVDEVSGAPGWSRSGDELLLPTTGTSADVTITGVLADDAAKEGVRAFATDERSAYEWWLVESDPSYRVEIGGEAKLVESSQSPIPPTLPTARVYLVQRGQRLEVDARSLVRGDVLAAVARTGARFVSVTSQGEIIGDETVAYDNNGLEHLAFTPAGQAVYVSTDGRAGRVLHLEAGSPELLVPVELGAHRLRVQTLSRARLLPLAGVLSVPASRYPMTTSAVDVTVGLPRDVVPVALLGGDAARWLLGEGDAVAVAIGVALACFAFRTRRARALGSLATAGLWFVSREAFVIALATLFVVGAVFLASRFLRGNLLLAASAASLVLALFGARGALSTDGRVEARRDLLVVAPAVPQPESAHPDGRPASVLDAKMGATPVSLSHPESERYVQTSRQLVTAERPFAPRLLYVTPTLLALLQLAWAGVVARLVFEHRAALAALLAWLKGRIARRTEPPKRDPEAYPPW
jgi:hypothetical protein